MDYRESYQSWLDQESLPEELRQDLTDIAGQPEEITDRFYRDLEFGTGGLRGKLGAGTNRMNIYTVAKATRGYCAYLKQHFSGPSVAIAYDSRINSRLFAETAARVLAGQGIAVHLYPRLMPTPALSFAVRFLHCSGGIVITASHNPAQYNGYKVYGPDGGQITLEAAGAIQAEIGKIDPFAALAGPEFAQLLTAGAISYLSEEVVTAYLQAVSAQSLLPAETDRSFPIVYTPLHGAGISCVPRCLEENGFTNLILPENQREPNGYFPTCPYPNPEAREALEVGLAWGRASGSELVLATDPDCDRVGAAVRQGEDYQLINGNQMGVLLFDFICQRRIAAGTMPKEPVAVKTIVTTPMAQPIARHYGVQLREVLTGFKFIGEQIGLLEQAGQTERYIFGFEESYGYLSGSFVRDKDGVNAALLICEMYAYYRQQGRSLLAVLEELYQKYGAYREKLLTFTFEGQQGAARMGEMMERLRQAPPQEAGGQAVTAVKDYQKGTVRYGDGRRERLKLPASNVIQLCLAGGSLLTFRPSGTEPKLKIYLSAAAGTLREALTLQERLEQYCQNWVKALCSLEGA